MTYFQKYQTLLETLKGNIDLQTRLLICKKVIMTIKILYDSGIAYHDIHTENILVYNDDVKIVDLDDSILLSDCNKQALEFINQRIKINMIILTLSCFYQIDFHDVIAKNKMNFQQILSIFPIDKNLKFYINQFFSDEDMNLSFEFLLDFFADEKVKKLRRINIIN